MNANTLRRLNWLWKHRHTHDGDTTQQQIEIIRQTVEQQQDQIGFASAGAHIHVERLTSQEIPDGGAVLEWDAYGNHPRFNFPAVVFPSGEIVIQQPGYYSVNLEALSWDTWDQAGTIQIIRTNASGDLVVGEWSATSGWRFEDGGAHFVPCEIGDVFTVVVDHGDTDPHDLAYARLAVGLIDHYGTSVGAASTPGVAGVVDESINGYWDAVTEGDVIMTSAQQPGDIMFMFLTVRVESFDGFPAGWTPLIDHYNVGNIRMSLLYKVCDGTEPSAYTMTLTGNAVFAGAVWVVRSDRDYTVELPSVGSPTSEDSWGAGDPIDPAAVSPGVSGNYLVFACVARNGGDRQPTSGPAGYELSSVIRTENIATTSSSPDPGIEVWRRLVAVNTAEDPGPIFYPGDIGRLLAAVTLAVRV